MNVLKWPPWVVESVALARKLYCISSGLLCMKLDAVSDDDKVDDVTGSIGEGLWFM